MRAEQTGPEPLPMALDLRVQQVAVDDAIALWYSDLREIARRALSSERKNHTLRPTELVNKLFIDLRQQERTHFNDRRHALNYSRVAFKNQLRDYAKHGNSAKHGGGWDRVSMSQVFGAHSKDHIEELIALRDLLEHLHAVDPRGAKVVDLSLLGYTQSEIAQQLDCCERVVRKELQFARAWLLSHLEGPDSR